MNRENRSSERLIRFFPKPPVIWILLFVILLAAWPAPVTGEMSPAPVVLETIRAGRHVGYSSVVFQFNSPCRFETPAVCEGEVCFRLKNLSTALSPFREYKTSSVRVWVVEDGPDLNVRISLPENFSNLHHFTLETPDRLVVNLYRDETVANNTPRPEEMVAPDRSGALESAPETRPVDKSLPKAPLMTMNFHQIDIREILSALAMQQKINVVIAQDVVGEVSVHLYQMPLEGALDAITRAGGFACYKRGDVYHVYKAKTEAEPQAERLKMRIFKLEYAEVDKVQGILEAIPGIRMIKIHEPSKTIIVEDTPENIQKIETLINYWDIKPKQVLIEAKILEVSLTDDMALGVNWEKIMGDVRIGTGGFSTATIPPGTGISPVPAVAEGIFGNMITGAGTSHQFTAALDALQSKTKVDTLSTPKILAIHGKPAKVQVGGQQGYKVTTTNVGVATETIEFIDTGTILEITPYIDKENNILLKVEPEINAARIEEGIPVVNSTVVSTWLMAQSGETVFIGGLIQGTGTETRKGVPCLVSIPILDLLFGRKTRGTGKSELIVLITPRIIAEGHPTDPEAIEKTKKMEKRFLQ